jgi:hypothetical protein
VRPELTSSPRTESTTWPLLGRTFFNTLMTCHHECGKCLPGWLIIAVDTGLGFMWIITPFCLAVSDQC